MFLGFKFRASRSGVLGVGFGFKSGFGSGERSTELRVSG